MRGAAAFVSNPINALATFLNNTLGKPAARSQSSCRQ